MSGWWVIWKVCMVAGAEDDCGCALDEGFRRTSLLNLDISPRRLRGWVLVLSLSAVVLLLGWLLEE